MFNYLVRRHLHDVARDAGVTYFRAFRAIRHLDDDTIEHSLQLAKATVAVDKLMAIGDGSIIDAIIKFFNSELGKALIAMLMKLLFGL